MTLQAIILALLQGITEFLPISSSAHLVLTSDLSGWPDQGLAFDVCVHLGSLGALLLYFRRDLRDLIAGGLRSVSMREHNAHSRTLLMLVVATLPIVVVGSIVVLSGLDDALRDPYVISMANLLFAPLLLIADRRRAKKTLESMGLAQAIMIGSCQALAVIPGTSRSGATMMAALALGYSRKQAARIAMLLAIPSIAGAGVLTLGAAADAGTLPSFELLLIGILVSFASAYASIAFLLKLVERIGMTPFVVYRVGLGVLLLVLLSAGSVQAAENEDERVIEELVVTADLGSLPGNEVPSLFGFNKSLLETPRSASTVTDEMMERYMVGDIDELIAMAPGSFTQSFFGIAGSLDIRGTTGETYFRGVRRLDNPGNYPTPIGATSRVDIIRGPASPIHGPAKIGGYLDFYPKSARIEETGEFIDEAMGALSLDLGSWERRVVTAEVGGPASIGTQGLGYWLYAQFEDSGSYYQNSGTDQRLVQASFDMDAGALRLQFGAMLHSFEGTQVAGWNRLTQDLIERGIYVTGSPVPLDRDGDGYVSHGEFDVDGDGFTDLNPFAAGLTPGTPARLDADGPFAGSCLIGATVVFGCRPDLLALPSPGTAVLDGDEVLVDAEDGVTNDVGTVYFDVMLATDGGWEWRNQIFFEGYDNLNENAYGFSQFHDSWVVEEKLVAMREFAGESATLGLQVSPSIRYTNFRHADDYTNEYFDRRDLANNKASGTLEGGGFRRLLATRIDGDYTEYYIGEYLDVGFAVLADFAWRGLDVLAGARYDLIDMRSRQPVDKLLLPSSNNFCLDLSCVDVEAADEVEGVSWTFSLSWDSGFGIRPYVTASRQATVIAGQGAEIATASILDGVAFDDSSLIEYGMKGSLLDDRLYFALSIYAQERSDHSAQQTVTNQASRSEGMEFELRWAASDRLLLTLGYSGIEVVNLNTLESGGRFSFIGSDDVPGVAPWALYGGSLGGQVLSSGRSGARRAGIPEDIWSLTASYEFGRGVAASASLVDVASTFSGYSRSVRLPAYRLVNLGLLWELERWVLGAVVKNVTDERYFRANFPNLFGGVVVLPELPRQFGVRVGYRW